MQESLAHLAGIIERESNRVLRRLRHVGLVSGPDQVVRDVLASISRARLLPRTKDRSRLRARLRLFLFRGDYQC